ncbi:glycoside hydrolase family 172 protein [Neglectibacter caecimuris]|uniref:glycoside hydrolase family 172 protein n=1 Tax=Neglectibacter caecimuris TaxID=3093658 RepID=UPI002AC93B25|nr:glycoside hydrolase family 172 protein [Neglectibacter sp. M00184]
MELFEYQNSTPVWVSFENPTGLPGAGGRENHGAKGHPFEYFPAGEEKILCDVDGPGVIRRIWFTLEDRSPQMLSEIFLCAYWDHEAEPSVCVPIGEFFCLGGSMTAFENRYFASPEGRSFLCTLPMPFRKHGKLVLENRSAQDNGHLFFDVALTKEAVSDSALYFHTSYTPPVKNPLGRDVSILPEVLGKGRFLGMNVTIAPSRDYGDSWWGEGEVKIYLNGEATPSLVGTGTEDYIGTAWGQGRFFTSCQGCAGISGESASFYRFHTPDPIFFEKGCRVELQAIGGAPKAAVKALAEQGAELIPLAYDLGGFMTHLYQKEWNWDRIPDEGFITFYRRDIFSSVAYYYLAQ